MYRQIAVRCCNWTERFLSALDVMTATLFPHLITQRDDRHLLGTSLLKMHGQKSSSSTGHDYREIRRTGYEAPGMSLLASRWRSSSAGGHERRRVGRQVNQMSGWYFKFISPFRTCYKNETKVAVRGR